MLGFVVRRAGEGLLTILGLTLLVFLSLHMAPGDPAALIAGNQATEAELTVIEASNGRRDSLVWSDFWRYWWAVSA